MIIYNDSVHMGKRYLSEIDEQINTIDEFFYKDGRLFMLFTSSLRIYNVVDFNITSEVLIQNFTTTPPERLDVEVSS